MHRILLSTLLWIVSISINAQTIVQLDLKTLRQQLHHVSFKKPSTLLAETIIKLPLPDGSWHRFAMVKNRTISPGLAKNYPQIRTFDGYDLDSATGFLKLDVSPLSLHAMILNLGEETIYIDPVSKRGRNYRVYFSRDDFLKTMPKCMSEGSNQFTSLISSKSNFAPFGVCQLTTYRLAVAATAEYTKFTGGTVQDALAAQVVTINRVNGIYETSSALTFEIIPNNDEIIYLNPITQPYTHGDPLLLVGENQNNLDKVIGTTHYDVGHVFDTGSGGGFAPGKTCNNTSKAEGTSALPQPVGNPFDVDFVAHELGHQVGASHTQNNNCGRFPATAVEPGSGSTVMSYAGICAPNVQKHANAYLHGINLQEIGNFINKGTGRLCGKRIPIGRAPIVSQPPNITVPQSSPFALIAHAKGAGKSNFTYTWEQIDNQITPQPPSPYATGGPNFRSLPPSKSRVRYLPNLKDLAKGGPFTWEVLPAVNRTMHFRLTVRGNRQGPSCNAYRDMTVTVAETSRSVKIPEYPFQMIPHTWLVGTTEYITWDVAGTLFPPFNEGYVDVLFSVDGGKTFPITILSRALNLGSLEFPVPLVKTNNGRIMIRGANGSFFAIWDQKIEIL